ncbi:MAG: MarR family transcriptional regulator [Ignavibacteria bacterium]|nr:MarR family transcriptional regulator [Ignavibacteria bacterium]
MTNNNFELNNSLGFLLSKSNSSVKNCFNRAIKECAVDATAEQWGIMNIINSYPGITQSGLAERSLKDKTNITRMLDVLGKNGYIQRKSDDNDRRLFRIFITAKGKLLLKKIVPAAIHTNEKASYGISKKELTVFFETLNKIYLNTKEQYE